MQKKPTFTTHVFICEKCQYYENENPTCNPEAVKKFRKNIKEEASKIWDKSKVRINGSGCLGQCDQGISCVIYPQGEWLLNLTPNDSDKVLKAVTEIEK